MRNCFLIFLFSLFALAADSQTVSNVKAKQEGQMIVITYELVSAQPAEINLFLSEDNGKSWNAVRTEVSGDVGARVTQGNKVIYWDVLQYKEKFVGNAFVFIVKVNEENKEIKSVKIGNQVWMSENLNVDHYQNGDPIPEVKDDKEWSSLKTGAWSYYNNDPDNQVIYGKLYNWFTIHDKRSLCPSGWHVPSDADWRVLEAFLGGKEVAGGKIKSTTVWNSPNTGGSNSSGFSALPGGHRTGDGTYYAIGKTGLFWSSSENDARYAWFRELYYLNSNVFRNYDYKQGGFSVRCIKD